MSELVRATLSSMTAGLCSFKDWINTICKDLEPWQMILYSCGTTVLIITVKDIIFQEESLKKRTTREFFRLVKKIPAIKRKIEEELSKTRKDIEDNMNKSIKGSNYLQNLPLKGFTEEEVLRMLQQYKQLAKDDWKKGKVSGTVYSGEDKLTELMAKTYGMFAWSNPLHPDVFPDVRKMEAEVVRMCCTMFNGNDNTCGSTTSGGTESIMLACLAYRNIARSRGIKVPEIIVPHTAHAAFDKAASFFHMKITHIPVDEVTCKVDVAAMKRAISRETCMLVVSAPSFPHGIIDPVEEVAALGRKHNVPVHVDCCLGGFLVPFMEKAGYSLAPFDFRVSGVTSISADTHKYGFAPKGSSVIMYRDSALHKQQFFVQPDWPGGIYASPTMAGSRAGAIIAACWATMLYFGEQGYINSTRAIVSTTRYITDELKKVDGIFVYGSPEVCVIGIGSKHFNIYRLFEDLVGKGWIINSLQFPSRCRTFDDGSLLPFKDQLEQFAFFADFDSIHLCVTMPTTQPGVADQFVNDIQTAVEEIMKTPSKDCEGVGAIYGMAQTIPDRSLVEEIAGCFLESCYNTKTVTDACGQPVVNGATHGSK